MPRRLEKIGDLWKPLLARRRRATLSKFIILFLGKRMATVQGKKTGSESQLKPAEIIGAELWMAAVLAGFLIIRVLGSHFVHELWSAWSTH
jgi:hypothetical protein